jgi:competence protein ComEA
MLKKLLMLFVALGLSLSAVLAAAVEVNSADEAALESVKGIGPVYAKRIIDERTKNGPFKSADDLADRVKGIGSKSVQNLEAAGLTINGSSAPPSGNTARTARSTRSTPTAATPAPSTAPATTATTATTGQPAETPTKRRSRKAAAASAPGAETTANPAATPASDGKATKPKRTRKSKAASDAAASGT